jgi:hypothetical protein
MAVACQFSKVKSKGQVEVKKNNSDFKGKKEMNFTFTLFFA